MQKPRAQPDDTAKEPPPPDGVKAHHDPAIRSAYIELEAAREQLAAHRAVTAGATANKSKRLAGVETNEAKDLRLRKVIAEKAKAYVKARGIGPAELTDGLALVALTTEQAQPAIEPAAAKP